MFVIALLISSNPLAASTCSKREHICRLRATGSMKSLWKAELTLTTRLSGTFDFTLQRMVRLSQEVIKHGKTVTQARAGSLAILNILMLSEVSRPSQCVTLLALTFSIRRRCRMLRSSETLVSMSSLWLAHCRRLRSSYYSSLSIPIDQGDSLMISPAFCADRMTRPRRGRLFSALFVSKVATINRFTSVG